VKLSAPPPPPPPPDEPEPAQPNPEGNASANAPPPVNAPAPMPAKALSWPAWFAGADFLLAAVAIVLAFLVASFLARNTDLWLHLAAGQRLLTGEYRPGADPFSYTGGDRTWVNHSILYDVGTYLLFRAAPSGMVLVLVKALAVALAFGLVIGIRRPAYPLWPWAAVAIVAVIAAAPRLSLSPLVGSVLLLAVTLFLLFRVSHRPNSWRFPIAIGITFWLWANVDAWFFIGLLTLALVLLGEVMQKQLLGGTDSTAEGEPIGPLPDVRTLSRALAIGIVACMLNPHHVRVWELPFELTGAAGVNADYRIRYQLYSPLSSDFTTDTPRGRYLGYNHNGLAYGILFVGGGLALGLGAGRLRFAHLALWAGFAILSLCTMFAIPFFVLVAIPIIAAQLNAMSAGLTLKSWGDPRSRFLVFGSAGGRVIGLMTASIACVLAWPGWMHPDLGDPAFARRVAWGIYRDAAMVRAAERLQEWHASGILPDDARGLIASGELANYCAWFAPREKVFLNTRYGFHRPEIADFIDVRKEMGLIASEEVPDLKRLADELGKHRIEYVAIHGGPGDGGMKAAAVQRSATMWSDARHWSPWYLNGRTMIAGWRDRPGHERPTFAALRFDPIALAFGKHAERLEPAEVKPIRPAMGWEEEFIRGVNPPPAGADEALGWLEYSQVRSSVIEQTIQSANLALYAVEHVVGGGNKFYGMALNAAARVIQKSLNADELVATPFLALRAARRAISSDPDHPDGYIALSEALKDNRLPLIPDERILGQVTALRQFLMRLPPPERYKRSAYMGSATQAALQLTALYLGVTPGSPGSSLGMPVNLPALGPLSPYSRFVVDPGDGQLRPVSFVERMRYQRVVAGPYFRPLDVARETLQLAEKYAAVEYTDAEQSKQMTTGIREWLKKLDADYRTAVNNYEREKEKDRIRGGAKLREQVDMALRFNLPGEALRLLADLGTDRVKEFGREALDFALRRVALELACGRLEDAAADIAELPASFDSAESPSDKDFSQHLRGLRDLLRMMTYQKLILEGNYAEAGSLYESFANHDLGKDPEYPPQAFKVDPRKLAKAPAAIHQLTLGLAFMPSPLAPIRTQLLAQDLADRILRPFQYYQRVLNDRRVNDSRFYWQRGFLFLIEGNIAEAKRRFLASRQAGVPDWAVPDRKHEDAERYLHLIEQAEKTGK
jgi:hypothetical protein